MLKHINYLIYNEKIKEKFGMKFFCAEDGRQNSHSLIKNCFSLRKSCDTYHTEEIFLVRLFSVYFAKVDYSDH